MQLKRVQFQGNSFLGEVTYSDGILTIKRPVVMNMGQGGTFTLVKTFSDPENDTITVYDPGTMIVQGIGNSDSLYAKYLEITRGIKLAQSMPVQ